MAVKTTPEGILGTMTIIHTLQAVGGGIGDHPEIMWTTKSVMTLEVEVEEVVDILIDIMITMTMVMAPGVTLRLPVDQILLHLLTIRQWVLQWVLQEGHPWVQEGQWVLQGSHHIDILQTTSTT